MTFIFSYLALISYSLGLGCAFIFFVTALTSSQKESPELYKFNRITVWSCALSLCFLFFAGDYKAHIGLVAPHILLISTAILTRHRHHPHQVSSARSGLGLLFLLLSLVSSVYFGPKTLSIYPFLLLSLSTQLPLSLLFFSLTPPHFSSWHGYLFANLFMTLYLLYSAQLIPWFSQIPYTLEQRSQIFLPAPLCSISIILLFVLGGLLCFTSFQKHIIPRRILGGSIIILTLFLFIPLTLIFI